MNLRDELPTLARLAGLHLSSEEEERLARDLGVILEYVARLDELDLATPSGASRGSERGTPLRPDRVPGGETAPPGPGVPPPAAAGFVRVPRVIS